MVEWWQRWTIYTFTQPLFIATPSFRMASSLNMDVLRCNPILNCFFERTASSNAFLHPPSVSRAMDGGGRWSFVGVTILKHKFVDKKFIWIIWSPRATRMVWFIGFGIRKLVKKGASVLFFLRKLVWKRLPLRSFALPIWYTFSSSDLLLWDMTHVMYGWSRGHFDCSVNEFK